MAYSLPTFPIHIGYDSAMTQQVVRGDARQRSFLDVVRETTERRQGPNVEALRLALAAFRQRQHETQLERRRNRNGRA